MAKTVKITTDNQIKIVDIPWGISDWETAIEADCTELVRTKIMYDLFREHIVMIVDESGAVKEKAVNLVASCLYGSQNHGYCIHGDVLLGLQEGPDTRPLENAELVKFFLKEKFPVLCDEAMVK